MPSRNSCHTPSTVLRDSLHIKGCLFGVSDPLWERGTSASSVQLCNTILFSTQVLWKHYSSFSRPLCYCCRNFVLIFNRKYTYCAFLDGECPLGFPNENKCMVLSSQMRSHWSFGTTVLQLVSLFCLFQTSKSYCFDKELELKFEITSDQMMTEWLALFSTVVPRNHSPR